MVYSKTTWVDDSSPDIDETNLNNIEDGIYKAQDFDSGEHIGDLPTARMVTNIEAAVAGKDIVPATIVVNNVTDEAGSLKIYGKNADALILGDATHEGGDISVYRDTSGNKQFFLDADAASNAIAMSVYGGVVAQNYLTVGQAALNTGYPLYVIGNARISDSIVAIGLIRTPIIQPLNANDPQLVHNIVVSGTDAIDHAVKLQIDFNDIIVAQATGDGAGGIINKAIGVFGVSPQVQQNHIADPTDLASCISALSTLLADMEGYGWLKSS